MEGVIGSIETETSSGLKFSVHGVVKRRNGTVIVWGRCVEDIPTGRTFGASTLGAYCANVIKH